jgi:DNA-binding transcriptional regulator YiaG
MVLTTINRLLNIPGMHPGNEIKQKQDKYRLKPAEVAAKAGISTDTLRRAYRNDVPEDTSKKILGAIETLRRELIVEFQCSKVG